MTAHKTGLVSKLQLQETQFGKSRMNRESREVSVLNELFGPTALYKPGVSFPKYPSLSGRREYVFWKIDDQPDKVPNWADAGVKDEVLRKWKLVQARQLALDAADALKAAADKKENTGKTLKTLAAGKKQIEILLPPKFSWMSRSMTDERLQISEVGDLTKPGAEFMKKVFNMRPGQVEVTTNVPKSEVYVIRLIGFTPFGELWDDFTSPEAVRDYLPLLVNAERIEVDPAWRAQVFRDAKYTKEGQASAPSDEPEGSEPSDDY